MTIELNAIERFKIIEPFLKKEASITQLSKEYDVSTRTLHRWVANYRNIGLKGLERPTRQDKGKFRISEEIQHYIEALALSKRPMSARNIFRLAKKKEPYLTYSTVYNIIQNIAPALLVLAQKGVKEYQQQYDLIHRFNASSANELWQADHTLVDVQVLDHQNQLKQPWLTIIMDDFSRAIAGYYLSFDAPSALQTGLALRQAIWKKYEPEWEVCGIPTTLYTDHGSDFTSIHIEKACIDLSIQLIFSTVGKPRGRGKIERFFETLNQLCFSQLHGFTAADTATSDQYITITELDEIIKQFLIKDYNLTHNSVIEAKPLEKWKSDHFLPMLPPSLEALDELLIHVAKTRIVHRDGIKFQGLKYIDTALAAYVGENVIIRYDPRDLAEIRVFYDGTFICRAICQEISGETVSLKDIVRARRQRQNELASTLKQRRSLLDQILEKPNTENKTLNKEMKDACTDQSPAKPTLKRYSVDD